MDENIARLEDRILELEHQRVKRLVARSATPKPRTTSPPPKTAPASKTTVVVEEVGGRTIYRTAAGPLPDDRSAWPTQIRRMVELAEKVDQQRRHVGGPGYLLSAPCTEPVRVRV